MVRPSRRTKYPKPLAEAQWEDGVDNGADGIDWDTGPFVDGTLTVEESDGTPSAAPVDTIKLDAADFTLVDNADGSVSVTTDEPDAAAHIADATDAHDASAVSIVDAGNHFSSTEVEGALQELGAAGGASFATPAIVLGTAAAAGAASTVIRSDSTIVAFDATSPTTQAIGDSAATGAAAVAARRDHKHAITNPLTTQDDLWIGGASGAPDRLAKGSDGQVLTVDPTTHHLVWATPGGGGSLTVEEADGSPTDSAITKIVFPNSTLGIAGHVATYTPAAASVPNVLYPLDHSRSFDGTYGDDFTAGSLNAKWTRVTQGSGEETYQVGPRTSHMRVTYSAAAAIRYMYQSISGFGTTWTFEACISLWGDNTGGGMVGLHCLNSSGTGVGCFFYFSSAAFYLGNIVAGAYSSINASVLLAGVHMLAQGQRIWLRLRRAGTTSFWASFSLNGETYSPEITGTSSFTQDRIAVGRIFGTGAQVLDIDWFDRTA